jgi:hypothetical protein
MIELNAGLCDRLKQIDWTPCHVHIQQGDFLDANPADFEPYDAAIMNPVFDHGADIAHILHALKFLKPGGELVGICAGGPRQEAALRHLAVSWEPLPAGTFEGTQVRSVLFHIRLRQETRAPAVQTELALA